MSWQRGLLESSNLAEMANRQIVNKNSNDMATGPFGKWRFWRKLRIKRKRRLRFIYEKDIHSKAFHFSSFLSLSINVEKVYHRLLYCHSTGKSWTKPCQQ